jgi:hypothetical protein
VKYFNQLYFLTRSFIIVALLLPLACDGQIRKFKNHEVIDIGGGIKVEILTCKGEGVNEICDVIYYTDVRQTGRRSWQSANKIRNEESEKKGRQDEPSTGKMPVKNKEANSPFNPGYIYVPVAFKIINDSATKSRKDSVPIQRTQHRKDRPNKLSVFIDCNADCDMTYIKTELQIVDFLLDMSTADVHVLMTEQQTGGGGSAIQLIFFGKNSYKKILDTLNIDIPASSTPFERRSEMLRGIKIGLLPFLLKSDYSKYIDVSVTTKGSENLESLSTTTDKWNYWTFQLGANGSYNSGQVYKSIEGSGYLTANRVTDKLKVSFAASSNYSNYKYMYEDSGTSYEYEVINSDYMFQHSLIASLSSHWGIGYQLAYSQNTFANNKNRLYGKIGGEYSIFPYKDVNTRFITISYGLDIRANQYFDTTIYFLKHEVLVGQIAEANFSLVQKWGTFSSTISYSNYLKDSHLNNLAANLNFNFRITGGLFFGVYVSGSRVRDQVYLVKGSADVQDVLTRRRQLASEYNFNSGVGLSYRFGSKLNNFVNETLRNL